MRLGDTSSGLVELFVSAALIVLYVILLKVDVYLIAIALFHYPVKLPTVSWSP